MKQFRYEKPFPIENGSTLQQLDVAYHTYGQLKEDQSNVVWICHHLTASSDAALWWEGMVGSGKFFDPERYFIVCANIIGSCYGTTGPHSTDPKTGEPYFSSFPLVTIRDMVRAHIELRKFLGIQKIQMLVGGSMGGYQALEWAVMEGHVVDSMILLSTSAAESAWGIAIHTAQRMAIEADCTWLERKPQAGSKGLAAARAIGLISYRNHGTLVRKQTDPDINKLEGFKASAYMEYQGQKLVNRFNAHSYHTLTRSMDTHNLARGRNASSAEILGTLEQRTLVFGIHSDILCPVAEQVFLSNHIPDSHLIMIDSGYGHDGFMVEADLISRYLTEWTDR
jgi:homoserine O-acetyltransferase/O-succinyltransferase